MKDYGTGRLPAKATLQQGRYVILHTVGKGGMGAVYLALDTQRADRSVAIKEMSQARLLNEEELQRARQRFQQEAAMLRALNHPNLPQVHDSFEERDRLYLVMDYIDGATLSDLLKQAPGSRLAVPQVVEFALQLCSVLHYLHCQQPPIIFRDLKPPNIMVAKNGQVYLIDFGIARFFESAKNAGDTEHFGTPGYAPPELGSQVQSSPRSDIYSLGATLHHCLTGRSPVYHPYNFPPVHQRNQEVPLELSELIQEMLALDPAGRPASAHDVQVRLYTIQQWLSTSTQAARTPDSGQIILPGQGHPDEQTQVAGQTGKTTGPAQNTGRHRHSSHFYKQISEINRLVRRSLFAASHLAYNQFTGLRFSLRTWSWSRDIWSRRFVVLFLTALVCTTGGSAFLLKHAADPPHTAGLALIVLLLGLIGINLTSKALGDPVPRSLLACIALALILAGFCLQALPEIQPALQQVAQQTTLNQLCIGALLVGAAVSLLRPADRFVWVEHLQLGFLAAFCTLFLYIYSEQEFTQLNPQAAAISQLADGPFAPILAGLALLALFRYARQFTAWDRLTLLCVACAAALLQYVLGFSELQHVLPATLSQQNLVVLNVFCVFAPPICALPGLFIRQSWLTRATLGLVTLIVAALLAFLGTRTAPPLAPAIRSLITAHVLAITTRAQVVHVTLALLACLAFLRIFRPFAWPDHLLTAMLALTLALLDNAFWQAPALASPPVLGQAAFNQQFTVISAQLPAYLIYLAMGLLLLSLACTAGLHLWSLAHPYARLDRFFHYLQLIRARLERLLTLASAVIALLLLWSFSPLQTAFHRWSAGIFTGAPVDITGLFIVACASPLLICCLIVLVLLCQRNSSEMGKADRFTLLLCALAALLLFGEHTNISTFPLLEAHMQLDGNLFALPNWLLHLLLLSGLVLAALLVWFWLRRPFPDHLREVLRYALILVIFCSFLQVLWPFFLLPAMIIFIQTLLLVMRIERVG